MYQQRGTLLCAIMLLISICSYAMDKQALYPLLDVTGMRQTNAHESDYLLSARTSHTVHYPVLTTVLQLPPPAYNEIYISVEESDKELSEAREFLEKRERKLKRLLRDSACVFKALERRRKEHNITSNAAIAGTAFGYYMISFCLHLGGDPRLWENQGKNWSMLPFANNFAGWLGSQFYGMTQCICRNNNDKEQ